MRVVKIVKPETPEYPEPIAPKAIETKTPDPAKYIYVNADYTLSDILTQIKNVLDDGNDTLKEKYKDLLEYLKLGSYKNLDIELEEDESYLEISLVEPNLDYDKERAEWKTLLDEYRQKTLQYREDHKKWRQNQFDWKLYRTTVSVENEQKLKMMIEEAQETLNEISKIRKGI